MSGSAPYAPLSHSSLSHTIYWISNSDNMTSLNPSAPFFYIIGHLVDCRGFLQVWFLLATPIPVSPCAPRYQTSDFPREQSWVTNLRPYGFVHDKFAVDRPLWHRGNESCAVSRDPSICASLFSTGTRPRLCQNIPMCSALSQMSSTRILLEDSSRSLV